MQGRSTFTRQEAEEIRRLLREKATADRSQQKVLRGRLRSRFRFYISDFRDDQAGFTAADFDELVGAGAITIEKGSLDLDHVDPDRVPGRTPAVEEEAPAKDVVGLGDRSPSDAETWYDGLRRRYRPERIRFLLVGESPPDPGSAERRFFYAPALAGGPSGPV